MRAFAVIMMIQGHTVDTFLANEYRTMDSIFYSVWYTLRGFTAPVFMFTAGLVFTYLLKPDQYDFLSNPRVKKGFKRALVLISIGYLLRYPTAKVFDFSHVTKGQWDIFFAVDALHLIGFGLLTILVSLFIAKRAHISFSLILYFLILFLLLFSPFISNIEWIQFMPQFLASYFTNAYGSLFPLFPWLIYVIAGAILGNQLYNRSGLYLKKRFSFSLFLLGILFILLSIGLFNIQQLTSGNLSNWFYSNGIILLRIGGVLVLNGIMAFIVRKIDRIPSLILETGKKTLLLYAVHIIILYGCAWFPGLYKYYARSFDTQETIFAVVMMFVSMLSLVQFSRKVSFFRKLKLAITKV